VQRKPAFAATTTAPKLASQQVMPARPQAPVPAAVWQGYQSIRFGADNAQQGFDLQKFLAKDISGGLEDVWTQATQTAEGKDVTPEDLLLALVKDFQKDLDQYRQSEDKRNYFAPSYLGKVLGMSNNLHFLQEKGREIEFLDGLVTELTTALAQHTVPPESRTPQAGDRLKKYFQVAKDSLNNVLVQAPQKIQTALVTEDFMLQIIAKQDQGTAGVLARKLVDELRIKPELVLEEFMSEADKAVDAKDADAKKPVSLTERVGKPDYLSTPGLGNQLATVRDQLKWNHTRLLMLHVPKSISPEKAVEALAQQEAKTEGAPQYFRINVSKYFEGPEANQGMEKLKQAIRELAREHPKVVLHLQHFEPALRRAHQEFDADLLQIFNQNGKVKLLLTAQEGMGHEAGKVFPTSLPGLVENSLEAPNLQDTVAHIQQHQLPDLQKSHPGVKYTPEALTQAVEMAALTRELLLDTALEFLEVASQRFPNGELTADRLKRAVKGDPHLGFATKVSLSGSYQRLGEAELNQLLEHSPEIVGADQAKDFLKRLARGIQDPEHFSKFGLTPSTRAIILGPSGTAKTDLVMQFAKAHQVPLIYVSGSDLGHLPDEQIHTIIHKAFVSAKSEANRRETRGEKPHVLVVVDNMEAAAKPVPNGPPGRYSNGILQGLADELTKLSHEENAHVLTIGIANSELGFHPIFQDKKLVHDLVKVEHPTLEERITIFQSLARRTEAEAGRQFYAPDLDFNKAARRLSGATGKVLNVVLTKAREQAMMDANNTSGLVQNRHLDEAITTLTIGPENRKLYNLLTPEDRRATAYHEGGHALTFQKMKEYLGQEALELLKVTVMPQGPALGVTFYVPESDYHSQTKTQLFSQLVSVVASHPAELLSLHDMTTGNSSDRQAATKIAATMVTQVAMGKNRLVYPLKELADLNTLPKEIRAEMDELIQQAENVAEVIIRGYAPFMETLVDRLAGADGTGGEETIQADEFKRMLAEFEKANPVVVDRVKRQVHDLMAPIFPERYPQGWFSQLRAKWFGWQPKSVFREVDRLNQLKQQKAKKPE
jgi:SpoVK/Ycf46/Vps4 family AAA+-type ATPase